MTGKVWILGDLLRRHIASDEVVWAAHSNAEIIASLLEAALGAYSEVEVKILDHTRLAASFSEPSSDPQQALLDWAKAYSNRPPEAICSALKAITKGDFVVAFECPRGLLDPVKRDAAGVLELHVHPARLLPDLLLLADTDSPGLSAALDAAAVPDQELFWRYGLWKGRYRQLTLRGRPVMPRSYGLLLGQMPFDAAVIRDGKFLDLVDFEPQIQAAARTHKRLVARPHPYSPFTDATLEMLSRIPEAEFSAANTYSLLCDPMCEGAYAISSSALHEARYLGVPATAFAPDISNGFPLGRRWRAIDPETLGSQLGPLLGQLLSAEDSIAPGALRSAAGRRDSAPVLRPFIAETWAAQSPEQTTPAPAAPALPKTPMSGSDLWNLGALAFGWHEPESWGLWGDGPVSQIRFAWTYGRQASIALELVAPLNRAGRTVSVIFGGRVLQTVHVDPITEGATFVVATLDEPAGQEDCHILLQSNAVAEPDWDADDTRRLGVGLLSLRIGAVQPV